jgi:hypothetical protein
MGFCKFEPPPPSLTKHIIWNLLLADKQLEMTQEILDKEKICHIVAILPKKSDFLLLNENVKDFPFTVLEYGDSHTTTVDKEAFKICGEFIDSVARNAGSRNVLVFCNNGYQRSIPFLVYYLITFHSDEVPSISKALSLILSELDKTNYMNILAPTIESVTKILAI